MRKGKPAYRERPEKYGNTGLKVPCVGIWESESRIGIELMREKFFLLPALIHIVAAIITTMLSPTYKLCKVFTYLSNQMRIA